MAYTKQLNVRNIEQKIIFIGELQGQISDGNWENARPYNHYQDWMLKYDEIKVEPDNVGRTFWAMKDNYNFNSSNLWQWDEITNRVLTLVNACRTWPERTEELVRHHWDLEKLVDLSAIKVTYTKRMLMTDLRDLKVIVKHYIYNYKGE